jgi:peptidoglycan-associated lipoprotein
MSRWSVLPLVLLVGCKSCGKEPPVVAPPVEERAPTEAPKAEPTKIPDHVIALARNFERVFFDFDAFTLNADGKKALSDNAAILQQFADVRVEIQGHADEQGTTDYNVSLGQKRAQSIVTYLSAQGVSPSRLKVVSYGEERPLDAASNERAWALNRRAEFVLTWGGDAPVKGTVE